MGRKYSISGNATNTASSTLPTVTVIGAASTRVSVYDIILGSDAAPAENIVQQAFQRFTAAGTAGSALTPRILGKGEGTDPAAIATSGLAVFSVGPTLTAGEIILRLTQHMRATVRWIPSPGGELVIPALAANGLAMLPLVVNSAAFNQVFTIHEEE